MHEQVWQTRLKSVTGRISPPPAPHCRVSSLYNSTSATVTVQPAGRGSPGDHCKDFVQDGRVGKGQRPDGRAQGPARDGRAGVQAAQREDQCRCRGGRHEEGRAWIPAAASRVVGDTEHDTKLTVLLLPQQEELSKTDQEVMKCKHHKKHYEDKRAVHLSNIKTLEANLSGKEQELQVGPAGMCVLSMVSCLVYGFGKCP